MKVRKAEMRTRLIKLGRPELSVQLEKRYRQEKDVRNKTRLLCVKLAAQAEQSAEEIAQICGCSRASVFEWLRQFRQGGFEELLARERPGPPGGEMRGLPAAVRRQLEQGVQSGRWATAEAARQWLSREHGIEKPYVTVWQWLKKPAGSCAFRGPGTPDMMWQRLAPSKSIGCKARSPRIASGQQGQSVGDG
jgi:transposase